MKSNKELDTFERAEHGGSIEMDSSEKCSLCNLDFKTVISFINDDYTYGREVLFAACHGCLNKEFEAMSE